MTPREATADLLGRGGESSGGRTLRTEGAAWGTVPPSFGGETARSWNFASRIFSPNASHQFLHNL